jgi:tetratricopeptide (TPR) repeat protein
MIIFYRGYTFGVTFKITFVFFFILQVIHCNGQDANSTILNQSQKDNQVSKNKISRLTELGKKQFSINLDSSRANFFDAMTIAFEIDDKLHIANISRYVGNTYWTEGNYELAFQYYFDALGYYEALNDTLGIALSFNNIGEVYKKQNDFLISLDYHRKSLDLKKSMGSIPLMSYYNIGEL